VRAVESGLRAHLLERRFRMADQDEAAARGGTARLRHDIAKARSGIDGMRLIDV
jgi:hypothetical protein